MEVWKDVKGYEDYYQVSNCGNIRRKLKKNYRKRKLVLQKGYLSVTFSKKGVFKKYSIHRLVALHFINNKKNKPCVNHIDGNKINNLVCNLEWCTYSENEQHSYSVLGKKTNGIINRKMNIKDIYLIKKMYKDKISQENIAKKFNVNQSTISLIVNDKTYIKHV